jgi:hypothetical protein
MLLEEGPGVIEAKSDERTDETIDEILERSLLTSFATEEAALATSLVTEAATEFAAPTTLFTSPTTEETRFGMLICAAVRGLRAATSVMNAVAGRILIVQIWRYSK